MAIYRCVPYIAVKWSAIAGLILAGALVSCATPRPPASATDRYESVFQVKTAPSNGSLRRRDEAIRALFAAHIRRNPEAFLQTALPSLHRGVFDILRMGYADEVSRDDFYHAHLVYPREYLVAYPSASELRSNLWILYHTKERPHRIRDGWLDELSALQEPFMNAWVAEVRATDFDYRDFFYGSRRIERRSPLPSQSVSRLAEIWQSQSSTPANLQTLKERIVYIHGSTQPGYNEAAEALFFPRSFLSPLGSKTLRQAPVHPPDYISIATVYFRRSSGRGPLNPVGGGTIGQETWPQRAGSAKRWYQGHCYTLVAYGNL